jgi:NAD(P)H-flavin reductase
MPSIAGLLDRSELESRGVAVLLEVEQSISALAKRINIPINSTSSPQQIAESKEDPWSKSGKYALGWVYFAIILLLIATTIRFYHLWGDKIRTALYKEEVINSAKTISPESDYELSSAMTDSSTRHFFPTTGQLPVVPQDQHYISSLAPINNTIALMRWIFYRPVPVLKIWKLEFVFPSLGVTVIVSAALVFVTLYCFVPQPLFYSSIRYGSPPLAIRAGMLAVAMMPWVVALSMKANLVTLLTGIGHERLNVLHRWGGYLMLFLALVHTVPFYITPVWDQGGLAIYKKYFNQHYYIYGTGVAALAPLAFLCIHSLPFLRTWMYEFFVVLHVPVSFVFLGMMFWHCHNYLTSWNYLFATVAIWVSSYMVRLFYLNWTNPRRLSWLIGEEAGVTILPENAIKVTIPTQVKWRPGQYVYLRMPGISIFENHPFTIASLCSDDFPSEYGQQYRDMTLVFRPFGGFTRKVLNTAIEKGPYKTYRAFIDGPYGGMQREMAAFDHVIFFAGGSGITAIASQLLDLIKRMRDGKAVTKVIRVVWALKRPETMEWFKEELRICREFAPPDSVHCQFFITAAERIMPGQETEQRSRPHSGLFHEKINEMFQGVASKRSSAYIKDEAGGDEERERELRRENDDRITALPPTYLAPPRPAYARNQAPVRLNTNVPQAPKESHKSFDFGFPTTPTAFQKSLMRFAFLPTQKKDGWRTEYGRPDIPYMLKDMSKDFGRRTCIFVCGPPSMRVDVANTVAALQQNVWQDSNKNEIFLHAENYAI